MSNDKLFTIAGTSTLNGVNTFRFATGKLNVRSAKLKRHGHTDVDLIELPNAMTKTDAVAFLVAQGRDAVVPTVGKRKAVELTAEQKAEAARAAKRERDNARKREKRAAERAAKTAEADAAFLSEMTGVEVGAAELLGAVADETGANMDALVEEPTELGVDADREAAAQEAAAIEA